MASALCPQEARPTVLSIRTKEEMAKQATTSSQPALAISLRLETELPIPLNSSLSPATQTNVKITNQPAAQSPPMMLTDKDKEWIEWVNPIAIGPNQTTETETSKEDTKVERDQAYFQNTLRWLVRARGIMQERRSKNKANPPEEWREDIGDGGDEICTDSDYGRCEDFDYGRHPDEGYDTFW